MIRFILGIVWIIIGVAFLIHPRKDDTSGYVLIGTGVILINL